MKAIYNISYGVYVLSAKDKKHNACIINTLIQVTSTPNRISVAVNKANLTTQMIEKTEKFNVSVLDMSTPFDLISRFGMCSGRDTDKFKDFEGYAVSENGIAYITEHSNSYISASVVEKHDLGSHILFIADVEKDCVLGDGEPLTYAFYQKFLKPKPRVKKVCYVCSVCGYVYSGEEIPKDFVCPICKHDSSFFEKKTVDDENLSNETKKGEIIMKKKYVCPVCGYVYEGDNPPEKCPLCGAALNAVEGNEMTWAAEHVVGDSSKLPKEIVDGLRMNFNGECSEVGMYLAMSRVAFREGYPEVGLYYEKAAYEEAEHAAKFAELLGEVVTNSTKKNLQMRVEAENGATAGKVELATLAKKLNLDAIHDTVHEMARDEARHGKAFKGLLERYFK